jgi:hypothetical protein
LFYKLQLHSFVVMKTTDFRFFHTFGLLLAVLLCSLLAVAVPVVSLAAPTEATQHLYLEQEDAQAAQVSLSAGEVPAAMLKLNKVLFPLQPPALVEQRHDGHAASGAAPTPRPFVNYCPGKHSILTKGP